MADHNEEDIVLLTESSILATKLYRPLVPATYEARADLVTRLENNRYRSMTLISAPAGYGKSVLASMWLDASDAPGCWISLDETDDEPHTFLAYMVAAIRSAFPDIHMQTQQLVDTATFPPAQTAARIMLNDLEQLPQRMLLVLDDLHVIRSRAIYDILAELLRHPSSQMHLVLIARRDPPLPISSLRAYGRITEIRTQDLRFSTTHTARLLSKMLNREVDEATVAALTQRTEGWPMAVNLATVAMRQSGKLEVNPDSVPANNHYMREYLLAEVVDHLDTTLKAWLLAIAWVDRFCPALCAAVFQPDDAAPEAEFASEEFVQRLRRENLFVIPLDSENRWFRLHHLFQQHLRNWGRNQYKQDKIALFHERAGAWFAREGLIDEALRHLMLAGDLGGAEELVLQHRYDLMNTEQWRRLQSWLRNFPDDVLDRSVLLMCTAANLSFHGYNFQKLDAIFVKAEHLLANMTPSSSAYDQTLGEMSIVKGFRAIGAGDAEVVASNSARALQLLPPNALDLRSKAYGGLAISMQMRGHFASGIQILQETLKEQRWIRPIETRLMNYLCMVCFMQGDLTAVQAWAHRVRAQSEELRLSESLSYARYFLGITHYLRCESDAAEPYLDSLIKDRATSAPTYVVMGAFALSLIRQERGDVEFAETCIDRITAYFQETADPSQLALLEAVDVELALRRGELDSAQRKQVGVDFDFRPPLWFDYIPQLTPVKLLIAEGTPHALGSARMTLEEFEARIGTIHRNTARVQTLVLLAVVCDAQGDAACADASLDTALALAEVGPLIRPFVDLGPPMLELLQRLRDRDNEITQATDAFITQILAAFGTSAPAHVKRRVSLDQETATRTEAPRPPGLLTAREMHILQMLATDRTPAEMAVQNVVSITTVRSQINSIYRKLNVNSRMEAVNRGRELNLL